MHIVYILFSEKLMKYYTGYTTNFDLRIKFHLNSEQRKFTHNASDWVLFLKFECQNKLQAIAIEKHIKAMKSKVYIENLIKYPEMIDKLLQKHSGC